MQCHDLVLNILVYELADLRKDFSLLLKGTLIQI